VAVVCLLCGIFIFHVWIFFQGVKGKQNLAVILEKSDTKFEPTLEATTHFKISEGQEVRIIDSAGLWLKIQRSDGKIGWVESSILEEI